MLPTNSSFSLVKSIFFLYQLYPGSSLFKPLSLCQGPVHILQITATFQNYYEKFYVQKITSVNSLSSLRNPYTSFPNLIFYSFYSEFCLESPYFSFATYWRCSGHATWKCAALTFWYSELKTLEKQQVQGHSDLPFSPKAGKKIHMGKVPSLY